MCESQIQERCVGKRTCNASLGFADDGGGTIHRPPGTLETILKTSSSVNPSNVSLNSASHWSADGVLVPGSGSAEVEAVGDVRDGRLRRIPGIGLRVEGGAGTGGFGDGMGLFLSLRAAVHRISRGEDDA
jgi:hypothetical protein